MGSYVTNVKLRSGCIDRESAEFPVMLGTGVSRKTHQRAPQGLVVCKLVQQVVEIETTHPTRGVGGAAHLGCPVERIGDFVT